MDNVDNRLENFKNKNKIKPIQGSILKASFSLSFSMNKTYVYFYSVSVKVQDQSDG